MEVVKHTGPVPQKLNRIDYKFLSGMYNSLPVGESVSMDAVYNITLFKGCLEARKVVEGVDFQAWTKGGKTFVKKLTVSHMMKV